MTYKKNLYFIYLAIFPLMVCSGIVYSIFALYLSELGASTSEVGLVFTIGAMSGAIGAPIFGRLSDKIGRKPILMSSMVIFFAVFIFYSIVENFIQIFPIQFLEGVGWSALGATTTTLIADTAPSTMRGTAIGMYSTVWSLGWVIGPVTGGWLAENFGFKTGFLICSILIFFGFIITLKFIKEPNKIE